MAWNKVLGRLYEERLSGLVQCFLVSIEVGQVYSSVLLNFEKKSYTSTSNALWELHFSSKILHPYRTWQLVPLLYHSAKPDTTMEPFAKSDTAGMAVVPCRSITRSYILQCDRPHTEHTPSLCACVQQTRRKPGLPPSACISIRTPMRCIVT